MHSAIPLFDKSSKDTYGWKHNEKETEYKW